MELTNIEKLAEAIKELTYAEMIKVARAFADMASDNSGVEDADWFASAFDAWADNNLPADE